MTKDALIALQGSIAKWQAILDGTGEDRGIANCPLCKLFWIGGCLGCPVYSLTGFSGCRESPYEAWDKYTTENGSGLFGVFDNQSRDLAKAELDFLISLLPSGTDERDRKLVAKLRDAMGIVRAVRRYLQRWRRNPLVSSPPDSNRLKSKPIKPFGKVPNGGRPL